MTGLIWILTIGWMVVALANVRQTRAVEHDWEDLLREHSTLPSKRQRLPLQES
jgi:hypothetical protein